MFLLFVSIYACSVPLRAVPNDDITIFFIDSQDYSGRRHLVDALAYNRRLAIVVALPRRRAPHPLHMRMHSCATCRYMHVRYEQSWRSGNGQGAARQRHPRLGQGAARRRSPDGKGRARLGQGVARQRSPDGKGRAQLAKDRPRLGQGAARRTSLTAGAGHGLGRAQLAKLDGKGRALVRA